MDGNFERVAPRLYQRKYKTSTGETSVLYYARFVCEAKKKRRLFALGADLKHAKNELIKIRGKDADKYDFDSADSPWKRRKRGADDGAGKPRDGRAEPWTFAEWAEQYPEQKKVRDKRSLGEDKRIIRLHLAPFFGPMLLTEITRESLTRYSDAREGATTVRQGKPSKHKVKRGTIANELALLRHALRIAAREDYKVIVPSFDGLIERSKGAGRALTVEERKKVLPVMPRWLARIFEFAIETCLSEGDVLRLTEEQVDKEAGEIVPEGGRKKTGVEQRAPLTHRALGILEEIRAERKVAKVKNIAGLIFTRDDGKPITRSMIAKAIAKATRDAGVKKFRFHDSRNTALTDWAGQGINSDIAMKAAGHSSYEMHRRYLDLQRGQVAAAFGLKNGNTDGNMNAEAMERKSVTA